MNLSGPTGGRRRLSRLIFTCRFRVELFSGAPLGWRVVQSGRNGIKVIAKTKGGKVVADEIEFEYQTEAWSKPARLVLEQTAYGMGRASVRAKLPDEHGVLCLDARGRVRFSVAGSAKLNDNLGTPTGSCVMQVCNGCAEISVQTRGESTVGVNAKGIPDAFCTVKGA